ncbi:MAG: hypothetical protein KatS3mg123_2349 [Burkholderiales bacterium]|nr:MAG: hypothetical protein KatS3mg123_2349 [Burkholderiales bacterium]
MGWPRSFWKHGRVALVLSALVPAALADAAHGCSAQRGGPASDWGTGFLVIAPDRGFAGNEEIREAFETFAKGRNAALAFVTDERTAGNLQGALQALAQNGARRAVALPLFISRAEPRWVLAARLLDSGALGPLPVSVGRAFGESYLAVEALADRFRAIRAPAGRRVVVVGYGAMDAETRRSMTADWQRIAERAAEGLGFASVRSVVWHERKAPEQATRQAESERLLAEAVASDAVVIPFHFGRKLDSMMSFEAELAHALPPGAELLPEVASPDLLIAAWMSQEANRHVPLKAEDLGIVILAHGADYHWNETMRHSVRSLEDRYKLEFVFSMADQPLIERAVERLERRAVRAIVIVRVFGLASAFRDAVERMIGWDVEHSAPDDLGRSGADHGHDDDGNGGAYAHHHGHGGARAHPRARIRAAVPMATAGGLEDDPLFAEALLDRAKALSREPSRETVILVAHGSGDDAANAHWLEVLDSLARQIKARGGEGFRAVRVATWREDWPEKRAPWIERVREMVKEATRDGGRALVIPARTNAQGHEREFLAGLEFELGEGFAPHPLFARWVEKQIQAGAATLRGNHIWPTP